MNAQEAAAKLNGMEYGEEGSKAFYLEMKASGLVAVFGASDDLMEFRGAIDDEIGAPGTAYITKLGLLTNDCDNDDCPHFQKIKATSSRIVAMYCTEPGYCFTYETAIPHATFEVVEDGEKYCRGIVFRLCDAA